jgi:hypothetical protein
MQTYLLASEQYEPSPYRIYVLVDAEKALKLQDYGLAKSLYRKAIDDETLLDLAPYGYLAGFIEGETYPKEYVTAFALFRLVTVQAEIRITGNTTNKTLVELNQKFPEGKPGYEFSEAANLFVKKIKEGKSVSVACSYVSVFIDEKYHYLQSNFDWSLALTYDNGTLCPY